MRAAAAAVMRGPERLEVTTFPIPDVEPGAVLMKVALSGVCGTDKHTFRGETKQYSGTPHEREARFPLICGHENVGTVAEIGGAVRDSQGRLLQVGDRIVPGANLPCGHCHFCLGSYPYYFCTNLEDYGNSLSCASPPHLLGGWADYMYLLPGTPLFRVPDDLPDEIAVLTEVMAVTHGIETAFRLLGETGGPAFGHTVAVIGIGPLGLCHLIKARLLGAARLVAIEPLQSRRRTAETFGATLTMDPRSSQEEERIAAVKDHTEGVGPDVVVDCSGLPHTFVESARMVRIGGAVIEAGAFVDLGEVGLNPADICARNVAILGVGGERARAYLPSMRLLAANQDRLPLERIVTHRFPLLEAERAIGVSQMDGAMKVVIKPHDHAGGGDGH